MFNLISFFSILTFCQRLCSGHEIIEFNHLGKNQSATARNSQRGTRKQAKNIIKLNALRGDSEMMFFEISIGNRTERHILKGGSLSKHWKKLSNNICIIKIQVTIIFLYNAEDK